jgi:hypothetical protein
MRRHLAARGDASQDARKRCTDATLRGDHMPSNTRTAKTIPPIIAAAKSCIATLKQLHRAAAVDLIADVRRDAARTPAAPGSLKSAKTARKL